MIEVSDTPRLAIKIDCDTSLEEAYNRYLEEDNE